MKKILSVLIAFIFFTGLTSAQEQKPETTTVFCEVMCERYNILKADVNVYIDFGIAEKGNNSFGWIYNTENDKKYSFPSRMNVLAFLAKRGWRYVDTVIISDPNTDVKDLRNEWHIILSKEVPFDYTAKDVIQDIGYRDK